MFVFSLKNYNKSRIHSARGAKDVDISLDGRVIFKGEVTQACGNVNASNDPSAYGEVCLRHSETANSNDMFLSFHLDYFIHY